MYKAVGGSERLRTFTMNLITVGFLLDRGPDGHLGPQGPGRPQAPHAVAELEEVPHARRSSSKTVWRKLRDYNRADFHPDDHDTTALVSRAAGASSSARPACSTTGSPPDRNGGPAIDSPTMAPPTVTSVRTKTLGVLAVAGAGVAALTRTSIPRPWATR